MTEIASKSLISILVDMNSSLVNVINTFVLTGKMVFSVGDCNAWNAVGTKATKDSVGTLVQLYQRKLQSAPIPRFLDYKSNENKEPQIAAGSLPSGWERRLNPDGRVYYVDHNTQTTSWVNPNKLSPGWERRVNTAGREYFVDHNTRTTSWNAPMHQLDDTIDLPGWELRRTPAGVNYFVDHNTKTTTFKDPRL